MPVPPSRTEPPASRARPLIPGWLAFIAVALVAVNLRPGASSVGPVLAELEAGLGMPPPVTGLLTALPTLCFALVGTVAVVLARRVGTNTTIFAAVAAIAVGLIARPLIDSVPLFLALSVVAFAGMALGNILVPAFIKQQGGARVAMLTTVYTTGIGLGSALPILVGGLIVAGVGWRFTIELWGLVAASALVPWLLVLVVGRRGRATVAVDASAPAPLPASAAIVRSPKAVALAIFFGVQSTQAYVQFGWLPQIYRDAGLSTENAALSTAILAGFGILGGLVMSPLVARAGRMWPYVIAMGLLLVAGYLGILFAPLAAPWLWSSLLGLSGFAFPTALALITARSRHPRTTARLSGFTQSVGYLLATAGPLGVGVLRDATGSWALPVWILLGLAGVLTASGLVAARPGFVDDELHSRVRRRD